MKKINLLLSGVIFSASLLMFSSCNDDDSSSEIKTGTATITGRVTAPLDVTNNTDEFAPSGTIIRAIINSEDLVLNPDPDANYSDIIKTTEVDASGVFTITVPANAQPVEVTLIPQTFEALQNTFEDGTTTTQSNREIFDGNEASVTVRSGQSEVIDLSYNVRGTVF